MTVKIAIKDLAVNSTFADVVGSTVSLGTGAKFDISKTDGMYSVSLDSAGTGYSVGDTITVQGEDLAGTSANDLILTVATLGANGSIATFGSVGDAMYGDGIVDVVISDVGSKLKVDTFTFVGDKDEYTISKTLVTSEVSENVVFSLPDFDRFEFSDIGVAYDNTAADVFALLAAGLGDVSADSMSKYLGLSDIGYDTDDLALVLVNSKEFATDAGGFGNETFVRNVWSNIFNEQISLDNLTLYTKLIDNGTYSKADLLVIAAEYEDFTDRIDLVGLQANGFEYAV